MLRGSLGFRIYLLLGLVLSVVPLSARDFVLPSSLGDIHFELSPGQLAIGYDDKTPIQDVLKSLKNFDGFASATMERQIAPLGCAVLRLPNISQSDLLAAVDALEGQSSIQWASPVFRYDSLEHITGPYLYLRFTRPLSELDYQLFFEQHGLEFVEECLWSSPQLVKVKRPRHSGADVFALCRELAENPNVEWAEPDFIRTVKHYTNDTSYPFQWHLNNTGQSPAFGQPGADIDAPDAWSVTTGDTSVVISVCDIGVQVIHPDLAAHVEPGYDAVNGDNDPTPETNNDGHGTCCAGLAAGVTQNGIGVAGVAYNCHFLGAKMGYLVGNTIQTNDTWIADCFNYTAQHAHVMSNSWGGGFPSGVILSAINAARDSNVVIFFAAGNENRISIPWPAGILEVIAVGGTNQHDDRCTPADWGGGNGSNCGTALDIVAPGNFMRTTDMTGSAGFTLGDYHAQFSGTSAACPVAAGVAALTKSLDPTLTPDEVQTLLQNTAEDQIGNPIEDLAGWDQCYGWGRVNAENAVHAVFGAPSSLNATSGAPTVPLAWTAPWRSPLRYRVYRSQSGPESGFSLIDSSATESYDDIGVVVGLTYWYKVLAVYQHGISGYTNVAEAAPSSLFEAPQNLNAQSGNDGIVPLSWSVPLDGTPVGYKVYRSDTGLNGTYNFISDAPDAVYNDNTVTNGFEYWYRVTAVYQNPDGQSGFSNAANAIPAAQGNIPPVISHSPLDDYQNGTGQLRALISDPDAALAIVDAKFFYREQGSVLFDSLSLINVGINAYEIGLGGLSPGAYDYFIRARDSQGDFAVVPENAPVAVYTCDLGELGNLQLSYDDGTAESYSYGDGVDGAAFEWAVKFSPGSFPFILSGASFAAAVTIPDTFHTPIYAAVRLADGFAGLPGTLIWEDTTGSIGNKAGGVAAGITHFAYIIIRLNDVPLVMQSEFYIVLRNLSLTEVEAFGRDANGTNNDVSFFYDPCDEDWFSEDNVVHFNAGGGNRIIRAHGYNPLPPVISHSPLDDIDQGSGVAVAAITDPNPPVSAPAATFFYRLAGTGTFSTLPFSYFGSSHYEVSLASLGLGKYEYYIEAESWNGQTSTDPANAPSEFYTFDVGDLCSGILAYDDGTAESYTYGTGGDAIGFYWGTRFTPGNPFYLCGAEFAAAVTIPTTLHSEIYIAVRLADGPGNMPGTLLWEDTTGSIGNESGGMEIGETYFAKALIRDADSVMIMTEDFYIIVSNIEPGKIEAFGRDLGGIEHFRSVFYDPCDSVWVSEDDSVHINAGGGNRLIHAIGYHLAPPVITIIADGDNIRLNWEPTGAAAYEVYSSTVTGGPFITFEGSTADTTFTDINAGLDNIEKYYQVISISH